MMAAVRDRYGTPDVVGVKGVERPEPAEGEVLVRVRAASVNRADLDGLTPKPNFARLFMGMRAPRPAFQRVGLDVAGVVEGLGAGVTRFRPGDEVFADMSAHGQGAFAEYVCAPDRAFELMPEGMGFAEAATLPHSAILAVQALRRRGGQTVQPGARVLIDGASGNVGPFAVQVAKALGAEVTGVASTAKLDMVRELGADHVIDYTTTDYTRTGERYDWIVDTDSHHPITRVRRALRPNGVYVTLGGNTRRIFTGVAVGPLISRFSDRWSGLLLWWKPFHPPDVVTLKELIAAGELKPVIDRHFPLSDVVEGLRYVDEGRPKGKVIIDVDAP
jgi:NADPH:quinone reductase-like Zn-dependent oxidoreductase